MSDPGGSPTGLVATVSEKLIRALPPSLIVIVLLNLGFLAAFVWHIDARADHSVTVIKQLLDTCLKQSQ